LKGNKVAIVTNSGGPGVMTADHAELIGLDISEPSQGLRKSLAAILSPQCGRKNPIDLTVEGTEEGYRETLKVVLNEYDGAVAIYVGTPSLESGQIAEGVCQAELKTAKPIISSFMAGKTVKEANKRFNRYGLPNYPTGERAISVLSKMAQYQERKSNNRFFPSYIGPQNKLPIKGHILEPDAMKWLGENGFPVLQNKLAQTAEEAVLAGNSIGYPVVMKVVSPDILHKSEYGGVVINIESDVHAAEAFRSIKKSSKGFDFKGVIVYPMIKGALEVIFGISRDSQFGPVVIFGMGGIYTELLNDISLRLAPLSSYAAKSMIQEVKAYSLLSGLRGQKSVNFSELNKVLVNFSMLPFKYPEIAEIDLNPVFLVEDKLFIGDVRIIRR